MKKIERYTAVVNPGDVVVNPPWFWHGILNQGTPYNNSNIVIGCPSRYAKGELLKAGFKSNYFMTIVGIGSLVKKYGFQVLLPSTKMDLQKQIASNRKVYTDQQSSVTETGGMDAHPFFLEANAAEDRENGMKDATAEGELKHRRS